MQKECVNARDAILLKIKEDVKKKTIRKRGFRKKLKKILNGIVQSLMLMLFPSTIKVKKYDGSTLLGCDRFGRDVEDGLTKYIKLLESRNLCISTIIVLGSRAKGSWNPKSDIDVTIIANNLPKVGENFISKRLLGLRRNFILSDRPLNLGIEPSGCCSEEDFLKKLEKFDINALDAMLYGRVFYDRGFWSKAKAKYEKLKEKYRLDEELLKRELKPL